jgi:chromate reductase, NAD(P)H dehydrogenase (quinone)
MLVLGISGSLRSDSHNTRLLRAAASKLPPGARMVHWDELVAIPPFSEDREALPAPAALRRLRHQMSVADAVLFATPEYNGSFPGQLKNALDWASRPLHRNPLRGKPVAVIGASTGLFGAVWAQADLRRVLGVIGAQVLDAELPLGQADQAFSLRGDLLDPDQDAAIAALVDQLLTQPTSLLQAA